ncbi:MAG: UPF0175 family protein [Thermodesulfobacteriota bacterium]
MKEAILEVRVPEPLLQFGLGPEEIRSRVVEWLVLSLFTEGRVSSGKTARFLDMTRGEFLLLLRTRDTAYVDHTPEELAEEFAAVDQLEVEAPS